MKATKLLFLLLFVLFVIILVLGKYYTSIVCKDKLSLWEALFSVASRRGQAFLMRLIMILF